MPFLLALTLLLAPSYVVRFSVFSFPTNLLMLWVVLIWMIFSIKIINETQYWEFVRYFRSLDKKIITCIGLFFLAGVISLFAGGLDQKKLGQFIVLFLQPISLVFLAAYVFKKNPQSKTLLVNTCYLLLAAAGIYALIQYFTLIGLPPAWWGNSLEPKRAIGFFVHPNFYALFSAPLLAFLIPDAVSKIKERTSKSRLLFIMAWLLGAAGLLLSLSRAGWLGVTAALLVYAIFAADKKIRWAILALGIVCAAVVYSVPNLRYRLITPFYGERSATSRVQLWQAGWSAIKDSPITGLGLMGFSRHYKNLIPDANLDTHNFPHNIFLDLWVETGLLGLISFVFLAGLMIMRGLKNRQNILALGVSLFLITLIAQGLIDNPYFKNDLAMVFWIILALAA